MTSIITPYLAIELTQACNLDCRHCLKGEARNKYISKDVILHLFDEVKYVAVLYFTGGEVFLAYEQMRMVLEVAKEKGVQIYNCSLLTNGTIYDERIYALLEEYFQDNFTVGISNDDFHEKSIKRVFKNREEMVLKNIEKHINNSHSIGFKPAETILINMGRSKELNVPKADFEAVGYFYDYYKGALLVGAIVYVNAEGYITEGNLEIELQEKENLGNVLKDNLSDIVLRGGIRVRTSGVDEFFKLMDERNEDYQHRRGMHLHFEDGVLVEFVPKSLDPYYEEIRKSVELFQEFILKEMEQPGEGIKLIKELDYSKYPHDLAPLDHNEA